MPNIDKKDYNYNVFLNMPITDDYLEIQRLIVFTILSCGFIPRFSLETDTGSLRLTKIIELMKSCRLSIHDISFVSLDSRTNLPRFNMPFELGICFGLKESGIKRNKSMAIQVLTREPYQHQKLISDLSGCDFQSYNNSETKLLILRIRDFLDNNSPGLRFIKANKADQHFERWNFFLSELPILCQNENLDSNEFTYTNFLSLAENW